MKKVIFETRQRASELMSQAVDIWQQSPLSEKLEGLEHDPVMGLMMTALAYQANEFDNEIARLRSDIIEEFSKTLIPFEAGHAIPATVAISTNLDSNIGERWIDDKTNFMLSDTDFGFIPLLRTRVFGVQIDRIVRIDGRRWKVSLSFNAPITDLSGMTFAFTDLDFKDLRIFHSGKELSLFKPWHHSELPYSDSFAFDSMLYGRSQAYSPSQVCLDLFARQNVRLYGFHPHAPLYSIDEDVTKVDLTFEFFGIRNDFPFNKEKLLLNAVILVNASLDTATLSSSMPIARVAGYAGSENPSEGEKQFMHMKRPADDQVFSRAEIEVRRLSADRFNPHELLQLLCSVINKYQSDFYAFQSIKQKDDNVILRQLLELREKIQSSINSGMTDQGNAVGTYLLLRNIDERQAESVDISYLTTSGASVNVSLQKTKSFTVPPGFSASQTQQIALPVDGFNEIRNQGKLAELVRYYMVTNNRIVTMTDIKLFCKTELITRFGLTQNLIKNIRVSQELQPDCIAGFVIQVNIIIADTPYVRRSMSDRLSTVSTLLTSMIAVRSTNIYPVRVNLDFEETSSENSTNTF